MRKCVVFSLYGGKNQYFDKFLINLPIYKRFFVGYDILLFIEDSMMNFHIPEFEQFDVKVFPRVRYSISDGMFWRFEPIINDFFNYEVCLIRDVDYVPSDFEFHLINSFVSSEYQFQILRLHYDHMMPIMGGLFGIKSSLFEIFRNAYKLWNKTHSFIDIKYNDDQLFLAKYVYSSVFKYSQIVTSNVKFLFENVFIVNMPEDIIVGGDLDRHLIDPVKKNIFVIYPPVDICNLFGFRGLRYFNYSYTKK
jgi:hypothetical protein